jgi:hypothetical protein
MLCKESWSTDNRGRTPRYNLIQHPVVDIQGKRSSDRNIWGVLVLNPFHAPARGQIIDCAHLA